LSFKYFESGFLRLKEKYGYGKEVGSRPKAMAREVILTPEG
jgi:hypothetical protein